MIGSGICHKCRNFKELWIERNKVLCKDCLPKEKKEEIEEGMAKIKFKVQHWQNMEKVLRRYGKE